MAGFAAASDLPPRLEKFHFPEASRSSAISGLSSVISVTCKVLEKISGITSTPTFSDLARMKGSLLKAGSSAIDRSSAETLPDKMERLRLPTLTSRPSAVGKLRLQLGAEAVDVDQKGQRDHDQQKDGDHDPDNFQYAFHSGTPSRAFDS